MKRTSNLKLKPVELWELKNIDSSDTYAIFDCEKSKRDGEVTNWEAAKAVALGAGRRLVYAYNKPLEESGALSRMILLTKENIALYERWKKV